MSKTKTDHLHATPVGLQRQHFETVARAMKTVRPVSGHALFRWQNAVDTLTEELADYNYRFDSDRFRVACGVDVENPIRGIFRENG
jgi:hypothetical protein